MFEHQAQLIRPSLRRLRTALKKLIYSDSGPRAILLVILLLLMMLAINGLNVLNSFVGRDFISSIEHCNLTRFKYLAWCYVGVFAASSAVGVLFRYCEESLGLLWRLQLTKHLVEAYLFKQAYYKLEAAGSLANPDQRLADDVKAFATTTLSFTLLIINGTITAVSFSGVLWSISPRLFWVAVLYAICGSALTIWVGRSLVQLNYNQCDLEADFRSNLIHVRQNAESIMLSHRETRFNTRIQQRLNQLIDNFQRVIAINRNLGFCTNFYNYMIQIIPALLIAPLFISGKVEFGVITQSAMAFAALLGSFSLIVTQFQSISAFSAVISRLTGLSEAIHETGTVTPPAIIMEYRPGPLVCQNLTLLATADGPLVIKQLNLQIHAGERWWVTAPSTVVNLALFRALAGFWAHGEGGISRPGIDNTFFLPERPYLPPGMLRDVLLRKQNDQSTTDEMIHQVLAHLGLSDLPSRVGGMQEERDWGSVLAISDLHLLTVARILLTRPTFAILDRPDSSLTTDQIANVLEQLKAHGIGVMVIAKHGACPLPCDHTLIIHEDGTWNTTR